MLNCQFVYLKKKSAPVTVCMWVEYPTVKAHLKSHLAESLSENLREEVIKKWELETLREQSDLLTERRPRQGLAGGDVEALSCLAASSPLGF